jgi:hypothetical protein
MLAASCGVKAEPFGVIDFLPNDSMRWLKRSASKRRKGITSAKAQAPIILQAFGFR